MSSLENQLSTLSLDPKSQAFASKMDERFPSLRNEFHLPEGIYFCGNSLGLQPKALQSYVTEELQIWATRAINGHFGREGNRAWASIDLLVVPELAKIVGSKEKEVIAMGSLTSNLHFLMASFYKPDITGRYKIIIEDKAFPSDHYAVESQIQHHGIDPEEGLVTIDPIAPSYGLTTEQIFQVIDKHADQTAILFLSGVQFYTGQLFEIEKITKYAQQRGILVGWDLAHAVGNVELKLSEWNVDFAVWCSYKYLNSGPGAIAGLFVNQRYDGQLRLAGWWGHDRETRFQMINKFKPIPGASGYQLSNPSVLGVISLYSSVEIFGKTDMATLTNRSSLLTGYLKKLLLDLPSYSKAFHIITPELYGSQLSLYFRDGKMQNVFDRLMDRKITVDSRRPDVIRVAPTALYNTFEEVRLFVEVLGNILENI